MAHVLGIPAIVSIWASGSTAYVRLRVNWFLTADRPISIHPIGHQIRSEKKPTKMTSGLEATIYLKEGRYRIETALHFSLTGGVYKAVDMDTAKTVIIKEARPHTSIHENGEDAIAQA